MQIPLRTPQRPQPTFKFRVCVWVLLLFVVRSAHTLLEPFVFMLMLVDQIRLLFLVHAFCLVQFAEQIV